MKELESIPNIEKHAIFNKAFPTYGRHLMMGLLGFVMFFATIPRTTPTTHGSCMTCQKWEASKQVQRELSPCYSCTILGMSNG